MLLLLLLLLLLLPLSLLTIMTQGSSSTIASDWGCLSERDSSTGANPLTEAKKVPMLHRDSCCCFLK